MNKVLLVDAPETFENFDEYSQGLLNGKSFSWESGLIGQKVALITIIKNDENEVRCIQGCLLTNDVLVV